MEMPKVELKYGAAALTRGAPRRKRAARPLPHVIAARGVRAVRREVQRALTEAGLEPGPIRLLAAVDALRVDPLEVPHPGAEPATAAEAAVARLSRMRTLVLAAIEVTTPSAAPDGATVRSAAWRPGPGEAALAELRAAAQLDAGGPDMAERLAPGIALVAAYRDNVAVIARMLLRLIGDQAR